MSTAKTRGGAKCCGTKPMIHRGGKSQLAGLRLPASSSIAVETKESETAYIYLREETKRLVLGSSAVLNEKYD